MPPTSRAGARQTNTQSGYTYVSVLIVLVAATLATQVTDIPSESARIKDREAEILFRGRAYRDAIEAYWLAGGATPSYPASIDDLLLDTRTGQRHLRRAYTDPITGEDWTLLYETGGRINGVSPRSDQKPRLTHFTRKSETELRDKDQYADWEFRYKPE